MIHFPVLRWGQPYRSLEVQRVVHFATGEPVAEVSQANAGLVARDLRQAQRARDVLREIPCRELLAMARRAGELFMNAELPAGDGSQTPEAFLRLQSATTGLPERLCRLNMEKIHGALARMEEIVRSLTRNLDLDILTRGYGEEHGVIRSFQAKAPALGLVLPNNSPGVHALWLPVVPLQIGLVLKPGSQEPWTPYRIAEAFFQAGIPREAIGLYPGGHDVGAAVLQHAPASLVFGGAQTVEQHRGNPRVQVHGPGFSKILFGEDQVDRWERYLDVMLESVFANSGRSCTNCSGIWVPRNGREIADALARHLGPVAPRPPDDPEAALAAFTQPESAEAIDAAIQAGLREPGVEEMTARYREGPRLVRGERHAYLRPTVVYCDSPERALANTEYLFPFVAVVECPQAAMPDRIGPTLVATAITDDTAFRRRLIDCTLIDRLNLGPIPTVRIDWLQPHEGNLFGFLFRERALQIA